MDVNHDLIAAGHPRLNFEFATYLASYPKHWKEKQEIEAKSWAIGQVVTAGAVVDLLAARALASKPGVKRQAPAPEAIWPEFSESECFACHHNLTNPSPYQKPGHAPGQLPWQTWPSTMLPALAKGYPEVSLAPFDQLRVEMARPVPDPDRVSDLAAQGKARLGALLGRLETEKFDAAWIGPLLKELAMRPPTVVESWDRAAQHELALEALVRASKEVGLTIGPEIAAAIREGSKPLDFPKQYDSPRNVSPP
jgi:hypothetical protein